MGFLIWCSFLVVSLVGWMFFIEGLGSIRIWIQAFFQKHNQTKKDSENLLKSFFRFSLLAFLQPSMKGWLTDLTPIGTSQSGDRRLFLLGLSLSRLTSVMILVLVSGFFMALNSSYLLVSAGLLWILSRWWSQSKPIFLIFLGLGLFLFGMELSLRQSSLVFSSALDLPFLFALGDSLWTTLIGIFLFSAGLGFIVQIPGLGFFVATVFVLTGLASLPSAVSFVLGDILGAWLFCALYAHGSPIKKYFYIRFFLFILSAGLVFLGFDELFFLVQQIFSGPYSPQLRAYQFLVIVCLIIGGETFLSMLFFHFFFRSSFRIKFFPLVH